MATITITLPPELEKQIRLQASLRHKPVEDLALNFIAQGLDDPRGDEHLLDVAYMDACAKDADPSVTLEEVRKILSKISGSLADTVIAERDERF